MRTRQPILVAGDIVGRRDRWIQDYLHSSARRAPEVVVDVGAGRLNRSGLAPAARYFATDIRPLVGVDFSADGGALPLRDDSVDVLLGLELLEHVPDPMSILREAARVVRPDGLVFFSVPSTFPRHDEADYWRFTAEGLAHLGNQVFSEVEVVAFGHTFESLAVLAAYYLQLVAHRTWSPLERAVPMVERLGYRLDRRSKWSRSTDGLHTLTTDLLLVGRP